MHAIPITQMEITRDASSLFSKDLPLHPYYKALTADILQTQGSLKYSKLQDIEDFFKQYICEKENSQDKSRDSQRNEYNYEENPQFYEGYRDSDVFPSSENSSKEEDQALRNADSATSLQYMLEKRDILEKTSKKPTKVRENRENAEKPQEYYAFPHKYSNYKYKKLQNFEMFPAISSKKRGFLQKNRDKSLEKAKFSTEISESSTFSRTYAQKALKTQQKAFLLPQERRSLILKNLAALKTNKLLSFQAFSTGNRWISPFLKNSLPRIKEILETGSRKTKKLEENRKNIVLCGKTVALPQNSQQIAGNHEKVARNLRNDFKKLYNELEVLRNLSKKDAKTLKIQRNPAHFLENVPKDCEILRLSVFLDYFKREFAGKNWTFTRKTLESCGFRVETEALCVNFASFVRFHRVVVEKIADFDEKSQFFAAFLTNNKEKASISQIRELLQLVFSSKTAQKCEKAEKLRVFRVLSLENSENSADFFEKSALQEKLLLNPEIIKVLSHYLL